MSEVTKSSMHDARDAEDTRLLAAGEWNALIESYLKTIIQRCRVRYRTNAQVRRLRQRVPDAPRLLDADCKSVEQMQLVNAVCRFAELARSERPA